MNMVYYVLHITKAAQGCFIDFQGKLTHICENNNIRVTYYLNPMLSMIRKDKAKKSI